MTVASSRHLRGAQVEKAITTIDRQPSNIKVVNPVVGLISLLGAVVRADEADDAQISIHKYQIAVSLPPDSAF